jgi:hypothetical protein
VTKKCFYCLQVTVYRGLIFCLTISFLQVIIQFSQLVEFVVSGICLIQKKTVSIFPFPKVQAILTIGHVHIS